MNRNKSKNVFDNWEKSFFTGLWLEVQKFFHSEKHSIAHTKFIIDVMKLQKKCKVLDIPCGNGRISNLLSRKGFDVTGVDINKYFLNSAKKETLKKNMKTKFYNINMYDITWENEFDSAICFWGSFGYSTEENNLIFLRKIFNSLKKNGKFLIDTITADTLLPRFQKQGWMKVGNILVMEERIYNVLNSRIDVEWTFIRNGHMEIKHTSIRLYTYRELINILKSIGFKKFKAYGSITKEKFSFNSRRVYLVAQK